MQPIEQFCCQNKECEDHGIRGKGNLSFRGWSGHEKWSFVGKKKVEEIEEDESAVPCCGQNWDHTAVDAESRLLLSIVPGRRTAENLSQVG